MKFRKKGFRFQVSGFSFAAGQKYGQVNQEKKPLGLGLNIGCCWVSHFIMTRKHVGWSAAGGETQQSLASAQPNLRKTIGPE